MVNLLYCKIKIGPNFFKYYETAEWQSEYSSLSHAARTKKSDVTRLYVYIFISCMFTLCIFLHVYVYIMYMCVYIHYVYSYMCIHSRPLCRSRSVRLSAGIICHGALCICWRGPIKCQPEWMKDSDWFAPTVAYCLMALQRKPRTHSEIFLKSC